MDDLGCTHANSNAASANKFNPAELNCNVGPLGKTLFGEYGFTKLQTLKPQKKDVRTQAPFAKLGQEQLRKAQPLHR